jgi:ABC-type bacteriocin/lantibiotic exporter with double-glycine peptidase domain
MRIGLKNQKTSNSIIHRYINYLNNQKNTIIQTALDQSLEHNYAEFQHIYLLQAKFNNGLTFFETMIHNLIYLLVGMLGCYLIIEQQNINIGQLIFLISLLGLMSGAFNGICGFIIKRIEYEQMSEIYKKFIMVDNYKNEGGKVIDEITSISINQKNLFSGEKYKHEPSLIKQLLLDENDQKDFYINDININNIDCSSYLSKIFLINYDTKINKERIYQNFDQHNSFFLKTMKAFKINLTSCDSLDVYEQSLINIATTTLLKNKIIILDDCLRYVSNSNKR